MNRLLLLICLQPLLMGWSPGFAQQIGLRHISVEDGLAQNTVYAMCQDHQGFMWFGTLEGLCYYDGYQFVNYQNDPQIPVSLNNNYIRSIVEDNQHRIWVGTAGGLNLWNRDTKSFTHYLHNTQEERSLISNDIFCLAVDSDDNIWVGTSSGVSILNTHTGAFRTIPRSIGNDGIPDALILSILVDGQGTIWIGSSSGITRYDPETKMYEFKNLGASVYEIIEGVSGDLFFGTDYGLYRYSKIPGNYERLTPSLEGVEDYNIRTLVQFNQEELWFGTIRGMYKYNLVSRSVEPLEISQSPATDLTGLFCMSSKVDSFGNIWFGTSNKGVKLFHRLDQPFEKILPAKDKYGIKGSIVKTILEDNQKNLWLGTEDGGISLRKHNSEYWNYFAEYNDSKNANAIVQTIYQDGEGSIWIGDYVKGLGKYNPQTGEIQSDFEIDPELGIEDVTSVLAIYDDHDNHLWLAVPSIGLLQFSRSQKKIVNPLLDGRITNQLLGKTIWVIFEDRQGKLWLGDRYNGLFVIDKHRQVLNHYHNIPNDSTSLSHNTVLSIFEDSSSRIWVGTEGGGLNLFDPSNGSFVKFRKGDGLPSDVVHAILESSPNTLWLSTNRGITRFHVNNKDFTTFDMNDGIQTNQFHYNAAFRAKDGRLLFGGVNGVTGFYPNQIIDRTTVPGVLINGFRILDRPVTSATLDSPIRESIEETNSIKLNYNQASFSFDYVALNYGHPEKVVYSYKMEGLSDQWKNVAQQRRISFSKVPYGDYVFQVRARLEENRWGPISSIEIKVMPPIYLSAGAYILYTTLTILTIAAVFWFINFKNNQQRQLELAKIEKESIEHLNKIKLQFFTNISHELRTPLSLILGPLSNLIVRGGWSHKITNDLKLMHRNAEKLLLLVNQLLDFRKQETNNFQLQTAKGDFVKFVEEIKLTFNQLADQKNIEFTLNHSEDIVPVYFDRDQMERVLFNLLSNAFKYTPLGGKVEVRLISFENNTEVSTTRPDVLRCEIQDNGEGIPGDEKDSVFERFHQVPRKGKNTKTGTGIGLALTKGIIEAHGGRIGVESEPDKRFTLFWFEIPVGNAHLEKSQIIAAFKDSESIEHYLESVPDIETLELEHPSDELTASRQDSARILVVDDNKDIRNFIGSILEDLYIVSEADDGLAALEMVQKDAPDLIISDVMMPHMNGIDLCRSLKTNIEFSHIPFILLSARTSTIIRVRGFDTGADDYLTKPFNANLLTARVRNLLWSRSLLRSKFGKDDEISADQFTHNRIDATFLKKCIDVVEEFLEDESFSVSNFCREMAMSRSHFHRKLKAITDQSASEFIRTIRLKKAKELLQTGEWSNSEVAYKVGFNSLTYFTRCFKNQYGETPLEYRKRKGATMLIK